MLKLTELRGRPQVVSMFFANCQFTCPVLVNDMKRIEAALPQIHCFDAFPAEDEAPLNALYAARGYRRLGVHRVLEAALGAAEPGAASPWPLPSDVSIRCAEAADLAPLLALHEGLFPNGYLKPSDFAEAVGDAARRGSRG